VNRDFHELYIQVKDRRPELRVLIGRRAPPRLLKDEHRSPPPPMERLHTLFQRRTQSDLTNFFASASGSNETLVGRITDHNKLKLAIREVNYK